MYGATAIVLSHVALALLLSWRYFGRYAVTRPPVGVFNRWDLAVMLGGILVVPYLYLILPAWAVTGLLTLAVLSVLYLVWEPVLRAAWAIWLVVIGLAIADIGCALLLGTASKAFFTVNNLVLALLIVGISNLWAQSGMKAGDVTLLAGLLAVYDVVMTWQLTHMADLIRQLLNLPFAPVIAWPAGSDGQWLGIGLGDMLLATVFPLVLRKAFSRVTGLICLVLNLALLSVLAVFVATGVLRGLFPVMLLLGPLTLLQYVYWRFRCGTERTMRQFLQAQS